MLQYGQYLWSVVLWRVNVQTRDSVDVNDVPVAELELPVSLRVPGIHTNTSLFVCLILVSHINTRLMSLKYSRGVEVD